LIVVDDASTDETANFLAAAAAADARLRFVRRESPSGAPAARNQAIHLARGEFITGLDDDDRFLPHRISLLVAYWKLLESTGHRPSCLYTQDVYIRGHGRETSKKIGSVSYEDMFVFNSIGNQIFAPKQTYLDAGLFDTSLPAWQDLEFFMRILKQFGEARLLDAPTYELDNTPRTDRISVNNPARTVRIAFERVAAIHAPNGGRRRQSLMLQVFSEHYRLKPSPGELLQFTREGFWLGGAKRLLQAMMR
jgi:glycosyltransferase involved in cell wall biosynthesis